MSAQWNLLPLESLGALRASGRDVIAFLQGQLSADLTQLAAERSLLAGYHNPQGRVLALLQLVALAPDAVLAILPRELAAGVVHRLSGFILRAKVTLAEESSGWRFEGVVGPGATAPGAPGEPALSSALPQAPLGVARIGATLALRVGGRGARWLLATPAAVATAQPGPGLAGCAPAPAELWRRLAVEAGEPQVHAATAGEFLAQMLNLDALGAIAFDKGCYTGQEVIARAHYRGRVKRRLQRFQTAEPVSLQPGAAGGLADGRAFRVVESVPLPGGGCEFLAVAPLPGAPDSAAAAPAAGLRAAQLPLPYALPD